MAETACVGEVRSSCGACCTAAVEAVVGEAGVLAEASCSPSKFKFSFILFHIFHKF